MGRTQRDAGMVRGFLHAILGDQTRFLREFRMLRTRKRSRRVRSMLRDLQGHDGHDVRLLREIGLPILREPLERALAQQAVLIVTGHPRQLTSSDLMPPHTSAAHPCSQARAHRGAALAARSSQRRKEVRLVRSRRSGGAEVRRGAEGSWRLGDPARGGRRQNARHPRARAG